MVLNYSFNEIISHFFEPFTSSIKFHYVFLLEYPDLPIPNGNPHPLELDSTHFTPIFSSNINWSNVTVYGLNTAAIEEIRYYQADILNIKNINFNQKIKFH